MLASQWNPSPRSLEGTLGGTATHAKRAKRLFDPRQYAENLEDPFQRMSSRKYSLR